MLAQDHIVERAWLDDPTRQMTLQDVQQLGSQPWQPYRGVLSRGYGTSVIWLRLRIDPQAAPAGRWQPDQLVLRIRPVYLDDIQVFDPLAPGGWAGRTGDTRPPRDEDVKGLDFLLPIARGQAPRDIWLRVESTSTRQIDVQVLNLGDLSKVSRNQQLLFSGYLALVLLFVVWGLFHWLATREAIFGVFALAQAGALGFALSSLGYLRSLWPGAWPAEFVSYATSVLSIVSVSGAILFHVHLAREFDPPPLIRRVHGLLLSLLPLKLALVGAGHSIAALRLNMVEILLAPGIFLLSACVARAWSRDDPVSRPVLSRPVVLGFYGLTLMVLSFAALPGLGLVAGGEIALYIVQAHGLMAAFLILLMLQYRALIVNRRQQETALALERSQVEAQQERATREEQEKLLTMLAHELKTSLSVMHLRLDAQAAGGREIKQAIRDMNAVIERCLQSASLGDRHLQARPQPCDLAGLVRAAVSGCAQPARMVVEAPPQLPATTDAQLMVVVLNNLLENACKYAAPGTPVHVQLAVSGEDSSGRPVASLEVRNLPGAAGWPDPGQVFGKYYRSPHARRQAGTGLGLYLVRHIVQALGARIRHEPDPAWVRFVVQLPLGRNL